MVLNQKEFAQEEMPEPEDAKPTTPSTTTPSTTTRTPSRSTTPAPTRTGAPAPGPNGSYQLWVGSFGQHDYAQRHAQTLSQQGIEGTVVEAELPDGRTVFRVRVGFFQSRADATTYGDRMKLDYWVARR